MAGDRLTEIPVVFYRTATGAEPVREWLRRLSTEDRKTIGTDLATLQVGWPIGMPLCRSLGTGLWEVRSKLANNRIARLIFFVAEGRIGVLHGFIKKTQKTPPAEIALAQKRIDDKMSKLKKNPHWGSTLDEFLDEAGIRETAKAEAVTRAVAWQLSKEMKRQGMSKARLAKLMNTSRAQVDRILKAKGNVTIETLQRAAELVGRQLRLELV
jgi:phage-related protein/DNA-binding phage protein